MRTVSWLLLLAMAAAALRMDPDPAVEERQRREGFIRVFCFRVNVELGEHDRARLHPICRMLIHGEETPAYKLCYDMVEKYCEGSSVVSRINYSDPVLDGRIRVIKAALLRPQSPPSPVRAARRGRSIT